MDKHDRFIAINQTLPGLEEFLKVVLGSEPLSEEAERQRIEFLRRLETVSRPPSLPPRPANLSELYRARIQEQNEDIHSGSVVPNESNVYKNDRTLDPVEFASKQRELSRVANLYKTYAPRTVVFGEKGSTNGGLYFPRTGNTPFSRTNIRDSIQSSSSTEDDIYEHLSLKGISPVEPFTPQEGEAETRHEEAFVYPSPPKTPLEHSGTGIYVGGRPGSFRASGGKGKLSTGWFKKEAKVYEEVYVSNLREPVIKGYLKDIKANKRRWCVLQGNRLHIFKSQDDPAIMIIDLLGCDIGVDDKKKISYSFRLTPTEGPGISLAIEDGQDLSPWMSAIMAAVVRRGSTDRPTSPLEGAYSLEQARAERIRWAEVDGGIEEEEEENFYEVPVDNDASRTLIAHSTPTPIMEFDEEEEDEGYDAPLPPLPIIDDYSSSESSSDEDESMEKRGPAEKAAAKKKIYDAIPADLLAELTGVKCSVVSDTNKSQDSFCEGTSANEQSLDLTDSHSEHSGNISNRHSYSEPLASDETGSSEPKEEKTDSLSRKRTSTALSLSMDSICSDTEDTRSQSLTSETSISSKGLGPKVKRRKKLVPAEAELQFLQDPTAMHSGILYQKRRLGVWSKRYCKIIDSRFKCYRNPSDQKPSLDFPILGYDISLMDSKDSKKSYCIKISHPSQEAHYFATDSRVSIERWIEVLSLAATGRLDVIAPYPPYFCAEQSGDELKCRSRESLLSSEGRLSDDDSADTLDELDTPSEKDTTLRRLQTNEEQSSFQAVEMPNDARNVEYSSSVQTQTRPQEDDIHQSAEGGVKERVHKKRKEKPSDKEGTKTPSTMSPPHSMFISESVDGQAKAEPMNEECVQSSAKDSTEDSSPKKDRRWAETQKKKKLSRGHSYDYRLRGNIATSSPPESAKNKHQSMRRKNSQTYFYLVKLFDKEGRFCGYLTEVKYNKFGTTHLRRWCVVKNGVLIIYNSDSEETPQGKLSLVDMWLTDKSDERRNKFAFSLEDKEGKATILQTSVKEDYQKWMGILELFTELRVERPTTEVPDPLRKADSLASDEGEGSFERATFRSKSMRAANKLKDEIYALTPGKVRTSLRMKLSQRVNVRDIFRKTHSSYDLEGAATEGPSSALPDTQIDTLAVFGGFLTQVEPDLSVPNTGSSRWCTIKEKELLVFSDHKATDPIQTIPLLSSMISDLSDNENGLNRFQVRYGNESFLFDALDKFDLNRWLQMLSSVTEHRNSSDDERPKCVGRLTSPTFTKKKILHRRTRSEALQEDEDQPPTTARRYTKTKEGSTSSTDRLMSGYLQEVHEAHGARTLLRRWCVATSDKFIVYDNQNSKKASFEWELSEMEVQDQSDMDAGFFGFCVLLGEEKLCFQVFDEDSARHWLSVLARYCHAVPANQPLFKPPSKWRSNSKEERRRSASDNDLKAAKKDEKETNVLEVLSEGRASGRKLLRRATEDSSFFRKFNRSEMFKAPWRASSERLEVKMRERSGRTAANNAWKRYSCGSLFDSEGKYSGHLMELITSELYSSQVRRWCSQRDDYLYVYDNEAAEKPIKIIPLFNAKVVDTSDHEACVYRFRIDYGDNKAVFFRALTRGDLEKWTTVISVKTAVLQDRSERQLRRSRTLSLDINTRDITVSSESDVTSPDLQPTKHLTADSISLHETVSLYSADSVFSRGISTEEETSISGLSGIKPVDPVEGSGFSAAEPKDEQSAIGQNEADAASETTFSGPESSDSNVKRVNRLSSIEDLSHIYENFLAFASAMAERSPAFQKELYHVYENVTQAFDTRAQNTTQKRGELIEEQPGCSVGQSTNVENELGSPSTEMSSEFEKISLREKEHQDSKFRHRFSGICGDSGLEKLAEVFGEKQRSILNSLVEDENENKPEGHILSGSLAGGTDSGGVTNPSTLEEESADDSMFSSEKKDLLDYVNVGEVLVGVNTTETSTSNTKYEIEEAEVVDNDESSFNVKDSVNATREAREFQPDEDENVNSETATDVVEPSSQTPLQNEDAQGNQKDVSVTLVHADHVSAVETEASSFYLVQEIYDQAWREIEGRIMGEPVIETSLQVHRTAESATDRNSSSSFVSQSAVDEGTAEDIEVQGSPDGKECEGQFSVSETNESMNDTASSESRVLHDDAAFLEDLDLRPSASQTEQSPLQSRSDMDDDIQTSDPILTSSTNYPKCEALPNVFLADSFDASVPLASTCSTEVNCEQTVLTAVCACEHAQVWEGAVTRVDDSVSLTTLDFARETLRESLNPELENITSGDDDCDILSSEISDTIKQEDNDVQDSNSEAGLSVTNNQAENTPELTEGEDNTVDLSETGLSVTTNPAENGTEPIQGEDNTVDSSETGLSVTTNPAENGTEPIQGKDNIVDSSETGLSVTTNPAENVTKPIQGKENTVDSSEHAEIFQSTDSKSLSHDSSTCSDLSNVNLSFHQDVHEPQKSPKQDTVCLTKGSSDEECMTPEGTIDFSERSYEDADIELSAQSNRELNFEKDETNPAEATSVVSSETEDNTLRESIPATEPESDSNSTQSDTLDSWSNSLNLEHRQDLTRSQMDILKAVTAAFEEILELHGDDSETDDTRL